MKLSEIDQPIHIKDLARDLELVKDIQRCLKIQQNGILGPTTSHALWRFAQDQALNNYQTQVLGRSLAQALLKRETQGQLQERFEAALAFVLRWEGGYVNNPADRGGETNMGVTWATYNAYRERKKQSKRSVRHITMDEVREIYKTAYWDVAGCNQMPFKLAVAVFDWQVNSGRGVRHLQECLSRSKVDGQFSNHTLQSLQAYLKKRGEATLIDAYLMVRESAYRRWATGKQRQFLAGWLNRLNALKEYLKELN